MVTVEHYFIRTDGRDPLKGETMISWYNQPHIGSQCGELEIIMPS